MMPPPAVLAEFRFLIPHGFALSLVQSFCHWIFLSARRFE
jgi:hypothetical protein